MQARVATIENKLVSRKIHLKEHRHAAMSWSNVGQTSGSGDTPCSVRCKDLAMGTWPMPSNRAGTWDPDSQSSAETQSPCVHLCHSRTRYAFHTKPNYLANSLQITDYEWCY